MKFNCGLSFQQKEELRRQKAAEHSDYIKSWHTAFAWFPKRIASNTCVWLELYERRWVTRVSWTGHYTSSAPKFIQVPVVSPVTE